MVQLVRHLAGSLSSKFGKDRLKIEGARDYWLHWIGCDQSVTDTHTQSRTYTSTYIKCIWIGQTKNNILCILAAVLDLRQNFRWPRNIFQMVRGLRCMNPSTEKTWTCKVSFVLDWTCLIIKSPQNNCPWCFVAIRRTDWHRRTRQFF